MTNKSRVNHKYYGPLKVDEIINLFANDTDKEDRILMNKDILPHCSILTKSNIKEISNFSSTFKKYKFNKKDIIDLTIGFENHMKLINIEEYPKTLSIRNAKKANKTEVNIVYSSLAVKYPNELKNYFESIFKKGKLSTFSNKISLIQNFNDNVDEILIEIYNQSHQIIFDDTNNNNYLDSEIEFDSFF